jgi:hypothetical protein
MKTKRSTIILPLVMLAGMIISGCTLGQKLITTTDETLYLTPIPEATIFAYDVDAPVTSRLQAVIAARQSLMGTRLRFYEPPEVFFAGEVTFSEAMQWMEQTGEGQGNEIPADARVWLVVFEGFSEIIPPMGTPTGMHSIGCTYVIIANNGHGSVTNIGGVACRIPE